MGPMTERQLNDHYIELPRCWRTVKERYAVHYRDGWDDLGRNLDAPHLTRMVALAYARTDSNGHARFARGELAQTLGVTKQAVQKLIDRAIRDKWLTSSSQSECLVAPPHVTDRRYIEAGPCPVHVKAAGRRLATTVKAVNSRGAASRERVG